MNPQIQEQNTNSMNRPCITSVCIDSADKTCYMSYSDTDSQVDYFHGISLGTNGTIEYLIKDGGACVRVYTCGSVDDVNSPRAIKTMAKIAKIAKKAGYINEVTFKPCFQEFNGLRQEWIEISGNFVRAEGH